MRTDKVVVVLLSVALIGISVGFGNAAYQQAYQWGAGRGYAAGHEEALQMYPQLSAKDAMFTDNQGNTFAFSQVTIIGEQSLIDIFNARISHIVKYN